MVLRLRLHCPVGPSGMRAEHLKMRFRAATRTEDPDPGNWENVVSVIQAYFRGVELTVLCEWYTVVVIPKGKGTNFRGIGLVEVLWKSISGIINFRILSSIQFHDAVHGFHAGRGTGTTTLKTKLIQNLIVMRETVLHSILLELRKAYNTLNID